MILDSQDNCLPPSNAMSQFLMQLLFLEVSTGPCVIYIRPTLLVMYHVVPQVVPAPMLLPASQCRRADDVRVYDICTTRMSVESCSTTEPTCSWTFSKEKLFS